MNLMVICTGNTCRSPMGEGILRQLLRERSREDVLVESGFVYGEHPFAMTVWNQDLNIKKSYITMADSDIF